MAAVPGGNRSLPRRRGRSQLGGLGGQGSRTGSVLDRPRFSSGVYAGGGQRGAYIPGSVPAPAAAAALASVVVHGPTLDSATEWEFDIDASLVGDGLVLIFLTNPYDDHEIGLSPVSTTLASVTDYTDQGQSFAMLSGAIGFEITSGVIARSTDAGATWTPVDGSAEVTLGAEPPARLFFSDEASGTFEDDLAPTGKWQVPAGDTGTVMDRTTDEARTGTHSLRLTSNAGTAAQGTMNIELPVPGVDPDPVVWDPDDYDDLRGIIRGWMKSASAFLTNFNISMTWYDSSFNAIVGSGGGGADLEADWARATADLEVPAEAAYVYLSVEVICDPATPAGETAYLDDVSIR